MSQVTRLRRVCGAAGADRFAAEDNYHHTLAHANVYRRRRARSANNVIRRLRSWIFGSAFSRRNIGGVARNLREVISMLLEDGEPELEAEFVGTEAIQV